MGWYYFAASRRDLVNELTQPSNNGRSVCIRKCLRGNVLWTVWEDPCGCWIGCDLLEVHCGRWGHKPMDESMGPYYYTCPLSYLDAAPVANAEWREGVRAYHASKRKTA